MTFAKSTLLHWLDDIMHMPLGEPHYFKHLQHFMLQCHISAYQIQKFLAYNMVDEKPTEKNVLLSNVGKNKVTSQTTMSNVHSVTGIPLISA